MTPELLKTELDRAEEAELQSEEQLRKLSDLIDKAAVPNPAINASDCAKLVTSALALNERLKDRAQKLRTLTQAHTMRQAMTKPGASA